MTWVCARLIDTVLVFDRRSGYMVDRHCVWCSMVDLVKWDNVQMSRTVLKMKNMCVRHSKLG